MQSEGAGAAHLTIQGPYSSSQCLLYKNLKDYQDSSGCITGLRRVFMWLSVFNNIVKTLCSSLPHHRLRRTAYSLTHVSKHLHSFVVLDSLHCLCSSGCMLAFKCLM